MLRKLCLLFGLALLVSISAHAQDSDKIELFGGYSYQRVDNSPSFNQNGWEASAQYKFTDMVGFVADFDGHYGQVDGVNSTLYTYMFGPQITLPAGRFSPFAQILAGAGHVHFTGGSDNTDNRFAWTVGVGVDYKIIPGVYWRIQAGYQPTYFFRETQNNARISTGLVVHF
jgi:opacity protein-like surface antigen